MLPHKERPVAHTMSTFSLVTELNELVIYASVCKYKPVSII